MYQQNSNAPFMPMNAMNNQQRYNIPNQMQPNTNRNIYGQPQNQPNYSMPMSNYNPNQMQPNQPSALSPCFIGGRIGNKEIVRFDYNTFLSQIEDTNWASNPIYKLADNVRITTPLSNNKNQMNMGPNIPPSKDVFSPYIFEVNNMMANEFNSYLYSCQERKQKMENDKESNRIKFINDFLGGDQNISFNDMLKKIEDNRSYIISKDDELKNRIQKYLAFIVKDNSSLGSGTGYAAPPCQPNYGNMNNMNNMGNNSSGLGGIYNMGGNMGQMGNMGNYNPY
ncbi:MAG: hypothetical protein MJ252_23750 [archaeon]|nr:hypothetical protein [archaeon]